MYTPVKCRAFEVWCLHIPVYDRTPFEGLKQLKPVYVCVCKNVCVYNRVFSLVLKEVFPLLMYGNDIPRAGIAFSFLAYLYSSN